MKFNIDTGLIEELSNLEYFIVKSPVNTPEFWKEWQEKYSRAFMSKVAVKKVLKTRKLSYEDIKRYKALLDTYQELVEYLENIKKLALSLRGIYELTEETDQNDEDIDLDF